MNVINLGGHVILKFTNGKLVLGSSVLRFVPPSTQSVWNWFDGLQVPVD